MSVEVKPYADRRTVSDYEEDAAPLTTITYSRRDYGSGNISFEIRPARVSQNPTRRKPSEKVVRRFKGFLVEDEGEEYKVAFVQDDELVLYYLPASQLREAGISSPNQPFQMDEIEIELSTGKMMQGYTFVPLAKRSDAFNDSIDLDKNDRRSKLSAIFKKFGKAED
jgi:hypothetical protein